MINGYLDPASGSAIIGAVAAGTAGVGVAARTMMAKMRLKKRSLEPIDEPGSVPGDETVEPTQ
jgi:hypothetical protein